MNLSGGGPATAVDAFTYAAAPFNATQANGQPNIIAVFGTGLGADVTDVDGNANTSAQVLIDGNPVTTLYAGGASVIRSAARDKLGIPRAILNALKTNDRRVLEQYEDVYPTHLRQRLSVAPQAPDAVGHIATDVIYKAQTDAPPATSPDVELGSRQGPHHSVDQMSGSPPNKAPGELPKIVAGLSGQGDFAAYNALRLAGYIRHPDEYLPDVYGRKEAWP